MSGTAKLLSQPTNYAVVQLPGRKFPGVVFQGDSLHAMLKQLQTVSRLADKHGDVELSSEIADLRGLIAEASAYFEAVCARERIELPYPASNSR